MPFYVGMEVKRRSCSEEILIETESKYDSSGESPSQKLLEPETVHTSKESRND